jgi:hypothetical protein
MPTRRRRLPTLRTPLRTAAQVIAASTTQSPPRPASPPAGAEHRYHAKADHCHVECDRPDARDRQVPLGTATFSNSALETRPEQLAPRPGLLELRIFVAVKVPAKNEGSHAPPPDCAFERRRMKVTDYPGATIGLDAEMLITAEAVTRNEVPPPIPRRPRPALSRREHQRDHENKPPDPPQHQPTYATCCPVFRTDRRS